MSKNSKIYAGLFFFLILAVVFQLYQRTLIDKRVHEDVAVMVEELTKTNMPPAQIKSIRSGLLDLARDVADPLNSSISIVIITMFNAILIVGFNQNEKKTDS